MIVMNLIFLDIDGVLNRQPENPRKEWKDFHANDERMFGFNPENVKNLKYIIDNTNAKIVVSSSWRHFDDYFVFDNNKKWRDILSNMLGYKVSDIFIGNTPSLQTKADDDNGKSEYTLRGKEIKKWVEDNKKILTSPLKMCVIDDEISDIISIINKDYVVKTDRRYGLTINDAKRVIEILKT